MTEELSSHLWLDAGCQWTHIETLRRRIRKAELFQRQRGRCAYCHIPMLFDFESNYGQIKPPLRLATVDHVIPRSAGGTDDPANLVLACGYCNSRKSSGPPPTGRAWYWKRNPHRYGGNVPSLSVPDEY